ncbi:MAG: hypothetical protein Q4F78_07305 [Bacillota bacterium]|nr:hypothetical protein [Bacillota bacterium]
MKNKRCRSTSEEDVVLTTNDLLVVLANALRELVEKTIPTIKEIIEQYEGIKQNVPKGRDELRIFIEHKDKYKREVIHENNAYRHCPQNLQASNRSMVRRSEKNQKQHQGY